MAETEVKEKSKFGKRHYCGQCSFSNIRPCKVQEHITRRHTNNRPFKCTHSGCDYVTSTKTQLTQHRVHKHDAENATGDFRCDYDSCTYSSSRLQLVKLHARIHMTKPDDVELEKSTKFKCSKCNFKVAEQFRLNRHMKIHDSVPEVNLKCHLCEFKGRKEGGLKGHLRRIHNIPPRDAITCKSCDFTSFTVITMEKHESKCKGEMPYSCTKCDFKTSVMGNLYKHAETHLVQQ